MRIDSNEKRDITITYRTTDRIAAALRDICRIEGTDLSLLHHEVMSEYAANPDRKRLGTFRTREVEAQLEAVQTAVDAVRRRIGFVHAGGKDARKRRTA